MCSRMMFLIKLSRILLTFGFSDMGWISVVIDLAQVGVLLELG